MTTDPGTSTQPAQNASVWRRMVRFAQRAQWLGVVLLVLWFVRRKGPEVEPTAPPHAVPTVRPPPSRLQVLASLDPVASRRAEALAASQQQEISLALGRVVQARARASEALRTSDPARAAALWEEALGLNPYMPEALCAVGRQALGRGEVAEARALLSRCEAADPSGTVCTALARAIGTTVVPAAPSRRLRAMVSARAR